MKRKIILLTLIIILMVLIPSTIGKYDGNKTDDEDFAQPFSNFNGVKIIRPKSGYLYLFDIIEIPIPSSSPIIIGDITCVAEQILIYPYTVKWEFTDWKYGVYDLISDNVSAPYWRCTYSNFNFGELQIKARFSTNNENVMSSDSITAKKFL